MGGAAGCVPICLRTAPAQQLICVNCAFGHAYQQFSPLQIPPVYGIISAGSRIAASGPEKDYKKEWRILLCDEREGD